MTELENLIRILKDRKRITIYGNSGGYAVLEYKDNLFYYVSGFGAVEECREVLKPSELIRYKKEILK